MGTNFCALPGNYEVSYNPDDEILSISTPGDDENKIVLDKENGLVLVGFLISVLRTE